jgi:flagellar protein FliO/FliZ
MRSLHAIFPAAVAGCLLAAPAALAADGENTKLNLPASGGAAQAAQHGAGGGSLVRTIVGLAVVLAVIYGLHWVLKQVKASKEQSASGAGLESVATLPLGTNRSLHLVRAGGELVLIGSSEHGVTPIRRYTEDEARALGLIGVPGATLETLETPAPKSFLDILRSKTVVR